MNKELIQKLFSKCCWDEQAEIDIEDFISVDRFAELIVRECADILMKPAIMEWDEGLRSELSDYNKGWVNGRLLGIEHIKEHFGVEE
jgi:hypothetical protein